MPNVGIVISNYNGWQDTVQCLESLQKQTCRDFEIILLDDASTNDSVVQTQRMAPLSARKSRSAVLPSAVCCCPGR